MCHRRRRRRTWSSLLGARRCHQPIRPGRPRVDVTLVGSQCQGVGGALGLEWPAVALQRRHALPLPRRRSGRSCRHRRGTHRREPGFHPACKRRPTPTPTSTASFRKGWLGYGPFPDCLDEYHGRVTGDAERPPFYGRKDLIFGQSVGEMQAQRRRISDVLPQDRVAVLHCVHGEQRRVVAVVTTDAIVTDSGASPYPAASHHVLADCKKCPRNRSAWYINVRKLQQLLHQGRRRHPEKILISEVAERETYRPIRSSARIRPPSGAVGQKIQDHT